MSLSHRPNENTRPRTSNRHAAEFSRQSSSEITNCYVTLADNQAFNFKVDSKADGQEVLDKVCKMLGIMEESEYFGIQFTGSRNDMIWLNVRNRLSRQIPGPPPYHLYFRVKFFVPPHTLLLEGTRHQFYLNVVQQLKLGLWDIDTTTELQAQLIALMAYNQFGVYNSSTMPCKYACFWSEKRGEIPADVIRMIANFHRELDGMTNHLVEYHLLQIAHMELTAYGVYFYEIKDIFDRYLLMGVGPEYVSICLPDTNIVEKYPYCRLQTVTMMSRVVTLNLLEDDGSIKPRNFQLPNSRSSNCLYRFVTEVHCFFRCDTVRADVISHTNRDLKDTFTSLFDHNCKDYTFDVRLTFREVYDRARRILHKTASNATPLHSSEVPELHNQASLTHLGPQKDPVANEQGVQVLVLERLREAANCRVCMDKPIDRVFFPCGHAICCNACSDRVNQCPVCRKEIELRHPCFLPWDTGLASQSPQSHLNLVPPSPAAFRRSASHFDQDEESTLPRSSLGVSANLLHLGGSLDSPTASRERTFDHNSSGSQLFRCTDKEALPFRRQRIVSTTSETLSEEAGETFILSQSPLSRLSGTPTSAGDSDLLPRSNDESGLGRTQTILTSTSNLSLQV